MKLYSKSVGEGMPIVMLHGFSLDHRMMEGCMEPIFQEQDGWRRLYVDLPGMGRSPGEDWIQGSDDMLTVVLDWLDEAVPDGPFLLAGESYGGYLAQGVLYRRMDRVKGMLLICPVVVAERSRRQLPPFEVL
jgi:pimeloyl-ACP methyl ester carboxylesterase